MCNPALIIVGIIGAAMAASKGKAQEKQLETQAEIARNNATAVRTEGALKQSDTRRRIQIAMGRQLAAYGAAGLSSISGTPTDALAGSQARGAEDLFNINLAHERQAYNFDAQAANLQGQANAAFRMAMMEWAASFATSAIGGMAGGAGGAAGASQMNAGTYGNYNFVPQTSTNPYGGYTPSASTR
ncbi:hypothetical protein [Pacificispira sp.]|uniref:hypothetical protein n=1 Tax=Pacificispira sp. TaxID=2888761 RepID=UPI003BAA81ED